MSRTFRSFTGNARTAAGRTLFRLSSAGPASPSIGPTSPANMAKIGAFGTLNTPGASPSAVDLGYFRSARVFTSDAGLLRVAASPTGALLDDAVRVKLQAGEANTLPRYLVTEVAFHSRSVGITLENSKVYPEQVFVKDFTSSESPALESGAVNVGDVLFGMCVGKRHIRSTGELSELTDFVMQMNRPIVLRFVRDLNPPLDIERVSGVAPMAAYWLRYLQDEERAPTPQPPPPPSSSSSSVPPPPPPPPQAPPRESDGTLVDDDDDNGADNLVLAWAKFSLDVRNVLLDDADEEALARIVERHVVRQDFLNSTWTEADASLASWWHARVAGQPTAHSLAQVRTWLDTSRKQTEIALSHAYFRRFLHSAEALELYIDANIVFQPTALQRVHAPVSMHSVLSRRPLANVFLVHLLSAREHAPLALWTEIEYVLRPLVSDVRAAAEAEPPPPEASFYESVRDGDDDDVAFAEDSSENDGMRVDAGDREADHQDDAASASGEDNPFAGLSVTPIGRVEDAGGEARLVAYTQKEQNEGGGPRRPAFSAYKDAGDESVQKLWVATRSLVGRFMGPAAAMRVSVPRELVDDLERFVDELVPDYGLPSCVQCGEPLVLAGICARMLHAESLAPFCGALAAVQAAAMDDLPERFRAFAENVDSLFPVVLLALFREAAGEPEATPQRLTALLQRTPLPSGMQVHRALSRATAPADRRVVKNAVRFRGMHGRHAAVLEPANVPGIAPFCVPHGSAGERGPPLLFNFCLSSGGGPDGSERLWGCALVTYVDEDDGDGNGVVPSGMAVVSELPLLDSLRARMRSVFPLAKMGGWCPDASAVAAAMGDGEEWPTPLCSGCGHVVALPALDFSLRVVFESLSLANLVQVFVSVLLERKVLLVSSKYTCLTVCAEALRALLLPLQWSHVYVPVLPRVMLDMLQCPTPFLVGIHASYAWKHDFPFVTDLVVVDLDSDDVTSAAPLALPPALHAALMTRLRKASTLQVAASDDVVFQDPIPVVDEAEVRAAFKATADSVLRGCKDFCYCVEHKGETATVFDVEAWIHSRHDLADATDQMFLASVAETQAFSMYLATL